MKHEPGLVVKQILWYDYEILNQISSIDPYELKQSRREDCNFANLQVVLDVHFHQTIIDMIGDESLLVYNIFYPRQLWIIVHQK